MPGRHWATRQDLRYYRVVRSWIEQHPGYAILDVGHLGTPTASWGEFAVRHAVDLRAPTDDERFDGIEYFVGEFIKWEPPHPKYDLVTCLQVLEHLGDSLVAPFACKLMKTGDRVLVTVPYRWKAGACAYHPQDPVTLLKVIDWMEAEPIMSEIIHEENGTVRLAALFNTQ